MVYTKEQFREYYKQNKEKIKERNKNWRKDNPEKLRNSKKNYRDKNKVKIKEDGKKYYGKYKIQIHKHNKEVYEKLKTEILTLLGNKCSNPFNIEHGGFISDRRCLQIDHINGGGCKDRKGVGGISFLTKILKAIKVGSKDYQLLCANCNWIKRHENNENPCNGKT